MYVSVIGRCQAIIWTNAGILFVFKQNFSEIFIEIKEISFKKMYLQVPSAKWWPICLSLNVLKLMQSQYLPAFYIIAIHWNGTGIWNPPLWRRCRKNIDYIRWIWWLKIFQVNIIVGTPGRLEDLISTGNISLESVRFFVLDECVSFCFMLEINVNYLCLN